jgi:hypothetical protein
MSQSGRSRSLGRIERIARPRRSKIDPEQTFAVCVTASLTKPIADITRDTERRGRAALGPTVARVGKIALKCGISPDSGGAISVKTASKLRLTAV